MVFKKIKKGEITTQQIVILIILVTSFVVILFFFFRLNLGEETDQELCRNSVVLKGSSFLTEGTTSLNCYRSYECLTEDGTCEGLTSPDKIEKIKNLDDIYQELAENMANCWWMFGEGKIDYIETGLTKGNYCSICSQILFDDSLKEINVGSEIEIKNIKEGIISKDKLYDYLAGKEISEGKTYLEYLLGTKDLEKIKKESQKQQQIDTFGNIEVGEQYFVVMGITNEVSTIQWLIGAATGTVAGIVLASNPIGWVTAGIVVATASIGGAVVGQKVVEGIDPEIGALIVQGRGIENKFMSPTIVKAESDKFKELNCEEIVTYN